MTIKSTPLEAARRPSLYGFGSILSRGKAATGFRLAGPGAFPIPGIRPDRIGISWAPDRIHAGHHFRGGFHRHAVPS